MYFRLRCEVCECALPTEATLKTALSNRQNDPVVILLTLVRAGCCPACGQQVSAGQTPDDYIDRYCSLLQGGERAETRPSSGH